jgi:small-conductance mechanosensitive channel
MIVMLDILEDIYDGLAWEIPLLGITIFNILIFIIVLLIGLAIVKIIISIIRKSLKGKKLPELVVEFLCRLISAFGNIAVILFAVGFLGFDAGSLVLGLSAILGLILAFGMQESFTNFFAGIWLATLRPIDKDEVVTVAGNTGKVTAVGMMATEFLTPDNKFITIPNRLVWGSPIENYSRMPIRRVDVDVGIGYSESVDKAINVALRVMRANKLILKDPAPTVVSTALADSSVNLQLRPWTKNEDYWTVKDQITQAILIAYRDEGIEIPFPQMDMHMKKE